jgi:hypothetical protein
MSHENKHERETDHGPHASGWLPGDVDQNTEKVKADSDPARPGIAVEPEITVIAGLKVGPSLLAKLRAAGIEPD